MPDDLMDELAEASQSPPRRRPSRRASPAPYRPSHVQTVEQTSKVWKATQLIGVLAIMLSAVSCSSAFAMSPEAVEDGQASIMLMIGVATFIVGFSMYVVGRVGAWWYHG